MFFNNMSILDSRFDYEMIDMNKNKHEGLDSMV